MTSHPLQQFAQFVFATPLSRELAWALLAKTVALALISGLFVRDPAPFSTIAAVEHHLFRSQVSQATGGAPSGEPVDRSAFTFSPGDPHGAGNRR